MLPDTKYTATIASPTWPLHVTTLYKCNSWPRLVEGWMRDCFCTIFLANGQQTVATVKCESNSTRDQAHQIAPPPYTIIMLGHGAFGPRRLIQLSQLVDPGPIQKPLGALAGRFHEPCKPGQGSPKMAFAAEVGGCKNGSRVIFDIC